MKNSKFIELCARRLREKNFVCKFFTTSETPLTSKMCMSDAISAYSKLASALDARVHRCRRVFCLQMSRNFNCSLVSLFSIICLSRASFSRHSENWDRCLTSAKRELLISAFIRIWSNLILCENFVYGLCVYVRSFTYVVGGALLSVMQFAMKYCVGGKSEVDRNGLSIFIHF